MKILKWFVFACLYLVLAAPLLVWGKFLFPFITPKTIYFRLLIEIALFLYILLIIYQPAYRPRFSKLTWLVFIYFLVITFTAIFGIDPYRSFWGNIERGEGLLTVYHVFIFFFLISVLFKTKRDWLRFFDISVFVSILIGLYALGQDFGLGFLLQSAGGSRLTATIGNASFLAAYLLLNLFLIMFLFANKKGLGWRIFYGLTFIFEFYIFFKTETRGALIGFLGGLFILAVLSAVFSKSRKIKFGFLGLLLVLILLTSVVWFSREQSWVRQNSTLDRLTSISFDDVTTQSRLLGWRAAWRGWKDRFILGYGYENYNIAFNKYFPAPIYRDPGSQVWFDRAHNIIFDQAVSNGLFGLLAYLVILAGAVWILWSGLRKAAKTASSPQNNSFFTPISYIIFICLLASYFAQNLFVFDTLGTYIIFYSVLGFISFVASGRGESLEEVKEISSKRQPQIFLIAILVLVLIFSLYFFNLKPVLANYFCARGLAAAYYNNYQESLLNYKKSLQYGTYQAPETRQSLSQVVPRLARSGQFSQNESIEAYNYAIAEMEKNIQEAPLDARNYLFLMTLYNSGARFDSSRYDKVVQLGQQALILSPTRAPFYYLMGQARMAQNRMDEGINYFKKAVEINPEVIEAHWNLAAAYIITGQDELAKQEFNQMAQFGFKYYSMENLQKLVTPYLIRSDYKNIALLYEEMVKLEPNNALLYTKLAGAYKESGQKTKAKEAALKALELDPSLVQEVEAFLETLE